MSILALNAGSSSLKFGLFDADELEPSIAGEIDWPDGDRHQAELTIEQRGEARKSGGVSVPDNAAAAKCAIEAVLEARGKSAPTIAAVGHRVVHGGVDFRESARIDEDVKAAIGRLGELAPLHNPLALKVIEGAEAVLPATPQVAVFDTTFYADLPPKAFMYPVPYDWYTQWGIRRFGFHGISQAWCSRRAAELLGGNSDGLRLISCHLGSGCSAAAIRGGQALATTMGFTPLEGLMMGTRCGSIDPAILLYVERKQHLSADELDRALHFSSGLLGVSGVSPGLLAIETAAAQGNERARLAFEMFAERARQAIGALATTLGGVDALVFTAGIGENSAPMRAAICRGLEFLGLELDAARNSCERPDVDIATAKSLGRILVIRTREQLMVAREARRIAGKL